VRRQTVLALVVWTTLAAPDGFSQAGQDQSPTPAGSSPQPAADSAKKSPDSASVPPDSSALQPLKTKRPDYPPEAREKRLQGQVWLKVVISETGAVEHAEVMSGDPVLANAAVDAVKQWTFKPFIKDGKAVKVFTKLPFDFFFNSYLADKNFPPDQIVIAETPNQTASSPSGDARVPVRVRVSSGVSQGLRIHSVAPVYPPEAKSARIQGTVLLQAVISKEGTIADLYVISGPPELVQAAMGAAQQWRYKPFLLNGIPVEMDTQIQVNFQLH
jgi:TonB family protein